LFREDLQIFIFFDDCFSSKGVCCRTKSCGDTTNFRDATKGTGESSTVFFGFEKSLLVEFLPF